MLDMSSSEVVQAYRRLYRTALQAVLFSKPARYQIRTALRTAFRQSPASAFSPRRIENTVKFLERARLHNGMEHKIVKNLLQVRWWQQSGKARSRL